MHWPSLPELIDKLNKGTATPAERDHAIQLIRLSIINDFPRYCTKIFPHFDFQWFHFYIMQQLQLIIEQGYGNIMIFMPTQHGKTLIIRGLLSYFFGRFPEKTSLYATYNEDQATDVSKDMLTILTGQEFLDIFPGSRVKSSLEETEANKKELRKLKKAKEEKATVLANVFSTRGSIILGGRGNAFTGKPGHLIIVDDPYKDRMEATSLNILGSTLGWWDTVIKQRQQPETIKVIMFTRWSDLDLAGIELRRSEENKDPDYVPWKVITFPGVFEKAFATPYDNRKEDGELLWPIYARKYADLKKDQESFLAQCQQRPPTVNGLMYERRQFNPYKKLPPHISNIIISIDPNFDNKSDLGSDFAVTIWGQSGADYYLLYFLSERLNYPQSKQLIKDLTVMYPNYHAVLIEEKANGPALMADLRSEISAMVAFDVENLTKLQRAHLVQPIFQGGNIYVPDYTICPQIEIFIAQFLRFNGDKKQKNDLVDSANQALIYLSKCVVNLTKDSIVTIPSGYSNYFGNRALSSQGLLKHGGL